METEAKLTSSILERAAEVGISPSALARKAGLSQPTISRWANGRCNITLKNYLAIVRALGEAEREAADWYSARARELRRRITRTARSNDLAAPAAPSTLSLE